MDFIFEIKCYVTLSGLKLAVAKDDLEFLAFLLLLPSAGITDVCH